MASIVSIVRKKNDVTENNLWNLAVANDESYIAQGVVVHNCKSYLVPNFKVNKDKNPELTPGGLKPSDKELEAFITLSENSTHHCHSC